MSCLHLYGPLGGKHCRKFPGYKQHQINFIPNISGQRPQYSHRRYGRPGGLLETPGWPAPKSKMGPDMCQGGGLFGPLPHEYHEGYIEWKTFTKKPPLYLSRISCNDPSVFKGISKGVGHRLRMRNSSDKTFVENVEMYDRAMAMSGYNYQNVKKDMIKFREKDPVNFIKNGRTKQSCQKTGCRAYFNTPFDLIVPHQES